MNTGIVAKKKECVRGWGGVLGEGEQPRKQKLTELKGSCRERKEGIKERDGRRERTVMAATLFPINEAERAITMGTNVRQSSAVLPTLRFA